MAESRWYSPGVRRDQPTLPPESAGHEPEKGASQRWNLSFSVLSWWSVCSRLGRPIVHVSVNEASACAIRTLVVRRRVGRVAGIGDVKAAQASCHLMGLQPRSCGDRDGSAGRRLVFGSTERSRGSRPRYLVLGGLLLLGLAGCPDGSASVDEVCNGLDDDGDGQVDEGFEDLDGDGFADCLPTSEDEICNGRDDDLDGLTDEGFPDSDGDGTADCVDTACLLQPVKTEADICEGVDSNTDGLWEVTVEQRVLLSGASGGAFWPTGPVLVSDEPSGAVLWVVASDTPVPDPSWNISTWALKNGSVESVIPYWTGQAVFRRTEKAPLTRFGMEGVESGLAVPLSLEEWDIGGQSLWSSEPFGPNSFASYPLLFADSSGRPHLSLLGAWVDLAVPSVILEPPSSSVVFSGVADLDLDGAPEILQGHSVLNEEGQQLFQVAEAGAFVGALLPVAGSSGQANILVVGDEQFSWFDPQGSFLGSEPRPGTRIGPPCLADFDGDGSSELGVVSEVGGGSTLGVYEADSGLPVWESSGDMDGSSGGCSAFDFDGDGEFELLYEGGTALQLRRGSDGELLYEFPLVSGLAESYPTVCDVDGDGSVEILVASQGSPSQRGVWVLGNPRSLWMPGERRSWPQHTFTGSSIEENLVVAETPPTPWLEWNTLRGMPPGERSFPNLVPQVHVCLTGCTELNEVLLDVAVRNAGAVTAEGLWEIEIRAGDGELLRSADAVMDLAPGTSSAAISFSVNLDDALAGLEIRVAGIATDGAGLAEWSTSTTRTHRRQLEFPIPVVADPSIGPSDRRSVLHSPSPSSA